MRDCVLCTFEASNVASISCRQRITVSKAIGNALRLASPLSTVLSLVGYVCLYLFEICSSSLLKYVVENSLPWEHSGQLFVS